MEEKYFDSHLFSPRTILVLIFTFFGKKCNSIDPQLLGV